jgi:hypothetical protein
MWVRLDDNFADDPVFDSVGPAASWLHVAGLCYSNRNLTDGLIRAARVGRLTSIEDPDDQVRQLVNHGVWQKVDGGYLIVHHLDRQWTRERVLLERQSCRSVRSGTLEPAGWFAVGVLRVSVKFD